jgi:predicted TIM-barrel fold metal-dependent hydrolase
MSIGTAILSLTAPGARSAKLSREANEFASAIRDKDPSRWGFFAAVPSLIDTESALEEIEHALDHLKADGITLFTRYGDTNMYLGHPDFKRIWDLLDARHAVVFIHPTHAVDTNLVNPILPQPIIDYPHETTRAAVDLIVTDTARTHPNCKIILSHGGGTLPYIATRAATVLADAKLGTKTREEFLEDLGAFYFDLALSSTKQNIDMLLQFTKPHHILFGSDFPYAPLPTIQTFAKDLDNSGIDDELASKIDRTSALRLFPRLSGL